MDVQGGIRAGVFDCLYKGRLMGNILGVIPARGGSKGIPNKNTVNLCGVPLIVHTIRAAQKSRLLTDYILSTDSQDISDCASSYGLKPKGLRPPELATDIAKTTDAVIYEVRKYEKDNGIKVDSVVLLQPTAPMRTHVDIDEAISLYLNSGVSSLISVYDAGNVHPNIMYISEGNYLNPVIDDGTALIRRQDFRSVYIRNGALYIASRSLLLRKGTFICQSPVPYIMPRERSINIDEPFDLEIAEWMMGRL